MRSLSSFFILCFVSSINGDSYDGRVWSHNRTFSLLKTGRFFVNSENEFMARVAEAYRSRATSYEYRFKFDQFPQYDKTIVSNSQIEGYSVRFASSCEPKGGNYTVQVEVRRSELGAPMHSLGTLLDTFELKDCQWIWISDDGPVTLGTPITFTAYNSYKPDAYEPSLEYKFKFDQFPQHDKTIIFTRYGVEYTITFESSSTVKPGNYTVQLDVWQCHLGVPSYSLGAVNSTFQLTDSLVGFIKKDQEYDHCFGMERLRVGEISHSSVVYTEMPVILIAVTRDPKGYFMGRCGIPSANVTYKWIINDAVQEGSSKVIIHTFSQPQSNNISVIVTATKTIGSRIIQKSGSFNLTLKSKATITALTVAGSLHPYD